VASHNLEEALQSFAALLNDVVGEAVCEHLGC
jgi:hypothetical protein